jgi:hypothetical protein
MIINLLQSDIDTGQPCDGSTCPVALAVMRALTVLGIAFDDVMVDGVNVYVWWNAYDWSSCELPESVRDFVEAFDCEAHGHEFDDSVTRAQEFELPLRLLGTAA